MTTIRLHRRFEKSFKSRILQNLTLLKKTQERILLFQKDPMNPIIKDHELKGSQHGDRAFSITGDIRIVYRKILENEVLFLDIGSHNQVY